MPLVDIDSLPDDARVWVFGADPALDATGAKRLLGVVDQYLSRWAAHGEPLTSARSWRDDRFLTVAVDQHTAGASGCSIDALFRQLQTLERELGVSLVGGGRIFYRDADGVIRSTDRERFSELARREEVGPRTPVFDPTVQTLGGWRRTFERPLAESWHAALI